MKKLLHFPFVHFTFSLKPAHCSSVNGYILQMYNVKSFKSSYISREDNKNGLLDFRLMKIAQNSCPELNLLQINICSYISLSLHCSRGNNSFSTQIQFQCNIVENSHILMWFTMASLDLTTEIECEEP